MRIARSAAVTAAAVLAGTALAVVVPPGPAAAASCHRSGAWSDFNGDTIDDVAISEPGAGRVHVLYGTTTGLTATAPDDTLLTATGATSGYYGETMAAGDFDGDGCVDLAVADPYATVGGHVNAGAVTIFRGSPSGLTTTGVRLTATNGGTTPNDGDYLGLGLATGDLNGDGRADLVVGVPNEDTVDVFLGGPAGLGTAGTSFTEGRGGVPGSPGGSGFSAHGFGSALATGDFDGDGHDDVAIGAPGETAASVTSAGAVIVLRGGTTATPLTTVGARKWSQGSSGVPGVAESGDGFGEVLATGDFRGDGRIDLAIGVPEETVDGQADAGAVNILYSAGTAGLSSAGAQLFDENSALVPGTAAAGDRFGSALATGLYSIDVQHDLAIGIPGRTVDGQPYAGAVLVLYGTSGAGLAAGGATEISQATPGVGGVPESYDGFGSSLANIYMLPAFGSELVVGTPFDSVNGTDRAGVVTVLHRTGDSLAGDGAQTFSDAANGVNGALCDDCRFGFAVA